MKPIIENNNLILASDNAERNEVTAVSTDCCLPTPADLILSLTDISFPKRTTRISAVPKSYFTAIMSVTEFEERIQANSLPNYPIKVEGSLEFINGNIQLPNIIQASRIKISNYHDKLKLPLKIISEISRFSACNIDDIGVINTGILDLFDMPELTKISDDSIVTDSLAIRKCPKLLTFPQDFSVGSILIMDIKPTELMPLNIKIKDKALFYIDDCENITFQEIPKNLHSVDLARVDQHIVNQVKDVSIKGDLCISNCSKITALSSGIKVGGKLDIHNCNNFKIFPNDIIVGGEIKIVYCPELYEIPEEWIRNLPELEDASPINITLEETSISAEHIDRYNRLANGRAVFIDATPKKIELDYLEKAINFWYKKSENNQKPVIVTLNDLQKQDVYLFLNNLKTSASYNKNKKTACILAKQLMNILEMLTDDDLELKERALAQFSEANSNCVDRTTLYLSKLQILKYIVNAEKASRIDDFTGKKLQIAAKYYFYMEDIELYAVEIAKRKKSSEEIEFFLALLIQLIPIFHLPITTEDANYTGIASLSNREIKQAETIIGEKVTSGFKQRLAEWEPWKQHQRFQRIKNKKYTELPIKTINQQQKHECIISRKINCNDPVKYAGNFYSYDELKKWYVKNGTDPCTKIPIELSEIYKIETTF
jgi:hypothetical protein